MKSISFNLKEKIAYINATSQNTMRLWMSTPPFIKISWTELTTEQKYSTLVEAFEGSKKGLPMPDNPKEFSKSIITNFGFNSWRKFCEGGRHCSIDLDLEKNQYCFTPMVYLRKNGSLYGIKEGIECIPSTASQEEVVTALESVLENIPKLTEEYYQRESETEDPLI